MPPSLREKKTLQRFCELFGATRSQLRKHTKTPSQVVSLILRLSPVSPDARTQTHYEHPSSLPSVCSHEELKQAESEVSKCKQSFSPHFGHLKKMSTNFDHRSWSIYLRVEVHVSPGELRWNNLERKSSSRGES